jgi:hypothetical protein
MFINGEKTDSFLYIVPWLIFVLFLIIQYVILITYGKNNCLSGDEGYYINKATYIYEHGELPRVSQKHVDIQSGKIIGFWNDYRTIGYPIWLSIIGVTNNNHAKKRVLNATFNFTLIACCLLLILGTIIVKNTTVTVKILSAVILGLQPWCFEFCNIYGPDIFNTGFFFIGTFLYVYSFYLSRRYRKIIFLFFGCIAIMITMFFRPEMILFIVFVPILLALHLSLATDKNNLPYFPFVIFGIVFFLFFSISVGYRYWFEKQLFAKFIHATPGLEEWGKTWINTEKERFSLVWRIRTGKKNFKDIPDRAFSDSLEKQHIQIALQKMEQCGKYTKDIDSVFASVAAQKKRNLFSGFFLPRIWFTLHLWLNLETNSSLLNALSTIYSPVRKICLLLLLFLKLGLITCPLLYVFSYIRRTIKSSGFIESIVFVSFGIFLIRTSIFGFALGSSEHRYVLLCWPFVMLIALYMIIRIRDRLLIIK